MSENVAFTDVLKICSAVVKDKVNIVNKMGSH